MHVSNFLVPYNNATTSGETSVSIYMLIKATVVHPGTFLQIHCQLTLPYTQGVIKTVKGLNLIGI